MCIEKQITFAPHGHILANAAVWSSDSQWLVYDVRSDPAGTQFDGTRIERVNVDTGEIQVLFESSNGACVGVPTYSPVDDHVVFIHGPENPTPGWEYSFANRRGVIVNSAKPGIAINLDARDLSPPFTPGALRGGTHLHMFSPDGKRVAFTYEDYLLANNPPPDSDINQRNVGVSVAGRPVKVGPGHPQNYDGSHFSVLVTTTTNRPCPGSDEISKAAEESWVGTSGYVRVDGSRQKYAIAFQGHVITAKGETIAEVFIVDLPEDLTIPGDGPIAGTNTLRPLPPKGVVQRRLTFTADRAFPGLQGPRHWLRSSPDGEQIAFLMKDDAGGVVQLWTLSPNQGSPRQLTRNPWSIASAFTWSPDGCLIAHAMDDSIFVTDVWTGESRRLTSKDAASPPRPEACVFSPDGSRIACVKSVNTGDRTWNQIFVVEFPVAPFRYASRGQE